MKSVAVFFGGTAPEREVSVITGVLTVNSIDKTRYNPIPIFIDGEGKWFTGKDLLDLDNYKNLNKDELVRVTLVPGSTLLFEMKGKKLKPLQNLSVAINCVHGERGEDGAIFGLLQMSNIPLASPSLYPASLSMDKEQTKIALKGLGVEVLDYAVVRADSDINVKNLPFSFPVIVKPNKLGSSIGISKAKNNKELKNAVAYALRFGEKAIIEPLLTDFIEINCAGYYGLNDMVNVSDCERPVKCDEVLSFLDKYKNGKRIFPADIDDKLAQRIKNITEFVYSRLGFSGIIRIDYMVCKDKIYLNEINSVPGSLAYYLFSESLRNFTYLLTEIIEVALRQFNKNQTEERNFNSGILSYSGSKSSKRL